MLLDTNTCFSIYLITLQANYNVLLPANWRPSIMAEACQRGTVILAYLVPGKQFLRE